jgi:hypothetical protein
MTLSGGTLFDSALAYKAIAADTGYGAMTWHFGRENALSHQQFGSAQGL